MYHWRGTWASLLSVSLFYTSTVWCKLGFTTRPLFIVDLNMSEGTPSQSFGFKQTNKQSEYFHNSLDRSSQSDTMYSQIGGWWVIAHTYFVNWDSKNSVTQTTTKCVVSSMANTSDSSKQIMSLYDRLFHHMYSQSSKTADLISSHVVFHANRLLTNWIMHESPECCIYEATV